MYAAKAVVALLFSMLTAVQAVLTPDTTPWHAVTIGLAILTAILTYSVPNSPTPPHAP